MCASYSAPVSPVERKAARNLTLAAIHQREDALFLFGILEGVEEPNLVDPTHSIEGVETAGVVLGEFGGLQVTPAEVWIRVRVRILPAKEMETQPAAIKPRDALAASKESDEE
jgi:hypothetical protein